MAKTTAHKKVKTKNRPKRTVAAAQRERPAAVAAASRRLDRVKMPSSSVKAARPDTGFGDDSNEGKYVYCIIKTETPLGFGPLGIGAEPAETHTVNFRDIAAVVSRTPMVVQDPTRDNVLAHQRVNETVMQKHTVNFKEIAAVVSDTPIEVFDATRENVLAHERVNETVMRSHTVIPMSFGTVFKTHDDIMELLRSAYDAFTDVLNKMQDKFEFGLKVLWDRDQIIREIEEEDEDIRRLKGEISSQKGSTYFARMQYGRLIDAALQSRTERYVAEIFTSLRSVSVASRSNKPIGDRMIMNAAFLVSREMEQAFDSRVKEIGQQYEKLTFKYTGPWPPYNFVNIRLKLERAH